MGLFSNSDFVPFTSQWAIVTAEANRLLELRGIKIEAVEYMEGGWYASTSGAAEKTHTGLLVDLHPIEKIDTAEGLLEEIVKWRTVEALPGIPIPLWKRAKRLLEKK